MKYIVVLILLMATTSTGLQAQENTSSAMLRHVVLFKFKDSSSSADIKKVEDAFRALPSKIKEVKDFEWGLNNSPEKLNQEFTHCFFVSFGSEADRGKYLPHPEHTKFVELLMPYLDKALVIDYWAGK